jgi:hypothetical protein
MSLPLRYIVSVVVALLLFCVDAEARRREPKVAIEGVERVTHLSTSGANLWVEVRNDRCARLVLKRGEVEIKVDGTTRVVITLRDKVVVQPRSSEPVLIPLRFKSRSSLSVVSLVRRAINRDMGDVTLSYEVRGGTMLFRRTLKEEDIALRDIIQRLGIEERVIAELEQLID